jgi:aryl-alcohol dehydrogenase-like predicted oxidoreductase
MERRKLGRASIEVTVVGLGGAPIGRGSTDRVTALRTVWAALEAGINLIDTSPHYGLGRSEILIGQALRERPDLAAGCYLSTKTGHYQGTKNHTYDATLRSVALSQERLRRSYLDIVHLHDLHTAEEWWRAMRPLGGHRALRELKEQGVIGAIGIGCSIRLARG